jgi:flagellar biosynthesis/type III secretory pathway M-ring protein FliF/YscJ
MNLLKPPIPISPNLWVYILAVGSLLLVGFVTGGVVRLVESRHREKLQEENTRLQADYNRAIGESRAHELEARELKLKDAAKAQAIEQGNRNVKALDDKIEKAVQKYENDKKNLGDCLDAAECAKHLCVELRAAGFTVSCPE